MARGPELLEELELHSPEGFSGILFDEIVGLLERHSAKLSDVEAYAPAAGPGSFTGVRVGMTAAKGLTTLAVALGLAIVGAGAAPLPPSDGPAARGLTGQLLVATDDLRDPRFHHVVLYMVHHDATGAMGLVVNQPRADAPLAALLKRLGRDGEGIASTVRVHYGGPVEPAKGFVLHTSDWASGESHVVRDGVAVTTDPAIFDAIAHGTGPRRALFALGYAGWGPGQLEGELDRGDWITVSADEALIFDDAAASKWARAMARRKIAL